MKYDYLKQIAQSCNIDFAVYFPSGGIRFFTEFFDDTFVFPSEEGIAVDAVKGITCIRKKVERGVVCVAVQGVGETVKNYALIITSLVGHDNSIEPNENEKLRKLLTGELNDSQKGFMRAKYHNFAFNHYVIALSTRTILMQKNVLHFIEAMSDDSDFVVIMDEKTAVFFRKVDESNDAYNSASEFARVLCENIKEEMRVDITISTAGTVHNFDEFASSYEKIIFASEYGKLLSPERNVYAYKDYVLLRLLQAVPVEVLSKALGTLLEKNDSSVFSDEELVVTAEEFMKNSLNISETSRNMFIHRNTLIYRLDKIKKETGLNIREFDDAMIFRLFSIITTILGKD